VRALVAAAALAASALLLPSAASPAKTWPNNVQVDAKEFYFTISRRTIPPGPANVQFVNYGEDPHDLRLQRVGGAHIAGTPVVQPGGIVDLAVRLLPGKYLLWCSIANHRALGMQTTLIVTSAAKRQ
jgi:plastocyanin